MYDHITSIPLLRLSALMYLDSHKAILYQPMSSSPWNAIIPPNQCNNIHFNKGVRMF